MFCIPLIQNRFDCLAVGNTDECEHNINKNYDDTGASNHNLHQMNLNIVVVDKNENLEQGKYYYEHENMKNNDIVSKCDSNSDVCKHVKCTSNYTLIEKVSKCIFAEKEKNVLLQVDKVGHSTELSNGSNDKKYCKL